GRVQQAGQADRFLGQVGPGQGGARGGGVALVEHEVQDVADRAEQLGALRGRRQPERGARRLEALLGPADPLGHGGLGDEEGRRDLGGGQAADGAQGQRDGGGGGQGRVAAKEDEGERVVL